MVAHICYLDLLQQDGRQENCLEACEGRAAVEVIRETLPRKEHGMGKLSPEKLSPDPHTHAVAGACTFMCAYTNKKNLIFLKHVCKKHLDISKRWNERAVKDFRGMNRSPPSDHFLFSLSSACCVVELWSEFSAALTRGLSCCR